MWLFVAIGNRNLLFGVCLFSIDPMQLEGIKVQDVARKAIKAAYGRKMNHYRAVIKGKSIGREPNREGGTDKGAPL